MTPLTPAQKRALEWLPSGASRTFTIQEWMDRTNHFYALITQGFERGLFARMVERGERDRAYASDLMVWLKRGNTLRLRDLAEPFGRYWGNLDFANVVDGLDSTRANMGTAPAGIALKAEIFP